jgi:phage gp29-like protein
MPDQTYAPLSNHPLSTSPNGLNVTEPDQVTGVPLQASEVNKKDLTTELGGTGTTIIGGFLANQDYNPDFTGTRRITVFDEMRLSDATVRAGLNMVKLPILSADWYIKEPSGDSELGEPASFVDRQLFKNPSFSWTALLRQILTMCENGNSIFEKVFEQLTNGKIGWKRLAPRLSKTIYRWTLQDGQSPGIYQILPTGKTAEIPRWKLLYFINEQEGSNYEGISLLRAAYMPWYYKKLYYKIDSIAAEKQGMGVPQIKVPNQASPQDKAKARQIAQNIRANEKAYHELPMGFTIEFMDTHADTLKDCKEMIDHHDRQISKAFLAQFLELGAQKSGSYALSSSQSKLFLLGLEYLTKIIQEEMNKAIKELCDLNFPGLKEDEYPTLEYGAIGEVDYTQLSEALSKLSSGGVVTPTPEMEKYLLNTMKIPVAEDLDEMWAEKEARAAALPVPGTNETLADSKGKQPNNQLQPNDKSKDKPVGKKEDIKAAEFIEDIMEFHEQLVVAIEAAQEKGNHAPTV